MSDIETLKSGLESAAQMMRDGDASAVMIVAIHAGGRGVRMWGAGSEEDRNKLSDRLMDALPLTRVFWNEDKIDAEKRENP